MKGSFSKKALCLSTAAVLTLSSLPMTYGFHGFKDSQEATWANDVIEKWGKLELIQGNDGKFAPNASIKRAEFAKMVVDAYDLTLKGDAETFKDVTGKEWFAKYVNIISSNGFMAGSEGKFNPNATMSRAEAAVVLAKIEKLLPTVEGVESFKDHKSIPTWSKEYVGAVAKKGYLQGKPGGEFAANDTLTRAEAVMVLDRAVYGENKIAESHVYNVAGTYGGTKEAPMVIEGDVHVQAADVVLNYVTIKGDLIIGAEVFEGDAIVEGVTVKGNTIVLGGGENSVYIKNSKLAQLQMKKKEQPVRLVVEGTTSVDSIVLSTQGKIDSTKLTAKTGKIGEIIVEGKDAKNLELVGSFEKVTVKTKDFVLNVAKDTVINVVVVEEKIEVKGTGVIKEAQVAVEGVVFEKAPEKVTKPEPAKPVTPTPGPGPGPVVPVEPTYTYKLQASVTGLAFTAEDKIEAGKFYLIGDKQAKASQTLTADDLEAALKQQYNDSTPNADVYKTLWAKAMAKKLDGKEHTVAASMVSRINGKTGLTVLNKDVPAVKAVLADPNNYEAVKAFGAYLANQDLTTVIKELGTVYSDVKGKDGFSVKVMGKTVATNNIEAQMISSATESALKAVKYGEFTTTGSDVLQITFEGVTLTFKVLK